MKYDKYMNWTLDAVQTSIYGGRRYYLTNEHVKVALLIKIKTLTLYSAVRRYPAIRHQNQLPEKLPQNKVELSTCSLGEE